MFIFFVATSVACSSPQVVGNDYKDPVEQTVSYKEQQVKQEPDKNIDITNYGKVFKEEQQEKQKVDISKTSEVETNILNNGSTKQQVQTVDVYGDLVNALKNKNYKASEELLRDLSKNDDDMKHMYMLVLDRLGDHEAPLKYWSEKLNHFNSVKGLDISDMAFCKKIYGFGRYELLDQNEFYPGKAILLYVEVKNFAMKKDGLSYKLNLGYNWELYDHNNKKITLPSWENAPKSKREDELVYQKEIADYSQSFLLPLPQNIAGGDYKLKVTVKDLNSNNTITKDKDLKIAFIYE